MKSYHFKNLILTTILFLSMCPMALCQNSHKKIRLVAFEYPPFYYMENNELSGMAVDITKELFGKLKLPYEITMLPLKRALFYLKEGSADGLVILIKTPGRNKYISFTDNILEVRGLVWTAADRKDVKIHFNKLEDLKSYKIGVTLGYSYGPEFDRIIKTMDVESATRDYNNYRKLMVHRIDIFPGNEIVAKSMFKNNPEFQGKFVHSDKSFIKWVLRMGVSRKSDFISKIPLINKGIQEMNRKGFIKRKVREYTE